MLNRLIRPISLSSCGRWLRSGTRFLSHTEAVTVDEEIDLTKPHTVVCKNGVIACWHPEEPFRYEHTKPIDLHQLRKEKTTPVSSVLKEDVVLAGERSRLRRGPDNSEIKEIFYTNKNEWYTRTREDRLHDVSGPQPKRK